MKKQHGYFFLPSQNSNKAKCYYLFTNSHHAGVALDAIEESDHFFPVYAIIGQIVLGRAISNFTKCICFFSF